MNIYDFDNTIYDGESTVDFFFFMLRKKPQFVKFIPSVMYMLFRYKTGRASFEEIEDAVEKALIGIFELAPDFESYMDEFWKTHEKKLKAQFLEKITPNDIIISASPDVLLNGIVGKIGTNHLFCSQVDIKNKRITFFCFGENKRKLFNEKFAGEKIDEFYSDNMADKPMMELAHRAYLVKGYKITPVHFDKHSYAND